ncbi:BTAD domain-containing putative transcriptional regulator [Spirillospora sp. CA-294931]|uniref:BTAD domain-containing putative transcriptional regulator n=1 Tax=Spirillospora sp. CA-294931 TaxID=3240042 RepID=UPI003D93488A
MRIGILGALEVVDDGRHVQIGGARLRALLTLLALEAGRAVPAERLIDDLWEDRAPAAAPNALQALVSRLRALIGRDLVESRSGSYRLTVPRTSVDAHDFEERVRRARECDDPLARSARLREALGLWRGPALADAAGLPFAGGPAARLEAVRRDALEERVDADLALGRHADLIPELRALAAADPLREPLRGRLMRALYGAGRQAEALAEYESLKNDLAEALGVDPSPELEDVHLALLRQDPALTPAGRGRGNLRARLTSFIGRDDDLASIAKLLKQERLVTLTGPGGAGKTRLALEAGERLAEQAPDGVWLVQLAPVSDAADVPLAVLTALGLRETKVATRVGAAENPDPLDRLAAALAGRRPLILLDNCEHLIDAAAATADRVLAECPGVRILATSREPLGITGETLWPVGPLRPPPPRAGAVEAMASPAVRLLADRAAAVSPGFTVNDENAGHVVGICRALDGMPLAIELAAARLRAMTPGQVAERLGDRFRLLTAGSRTALPRHQTLRAVVEWSWDLLDASEKLVLRRLAVFSGGATPAAAEAVCGRDVLDELTALVDKSLVIAADTGSGPRYRLLETIRAYGMERLAEAGEEDEAWRAHALHFLALAEEAEPHLYRHEQLEWLARLTAEHDNLHAALRCAIGRADTPLATRLCAALGWYWFIGGRTSEGIELVNEVLDLPDLPFDETAALVLALGVSTTFADSPGTAAKNESRARRVQEICASLPGGPRHPMLRVTGALMEMHTLGWNEGIVDRVVPLLDDQDPWTRGFGYFLHGQIRMDFGHNEDLNRDFSQALAAFREAGDRWGLSFTLMSQADLLARDGEHRAAIPLFEEALALSTALDAGKEMSLRVKTRLATELAMLGDDARADALLAEALRDAELSGSHDSLGVVHSTLGALARRRGCPEAAARSFEIAERSMEAGQTPRQFRALGLATRALLDLDHGDREACAARLARAIADAVAVFDHPALAYVLSAHAALALHDHDAVRAAELLGTAHALRGTHDLSQPDLIDIEHATRQSLGEPSFTQAFNRGQTKTFTDVLTDFSLDPPHGLIP